MYTKEFVQSGHKTCVTITRDRLGWDLREERDNAVVRQVHISDWHRVERALLLFELTKTLEANNS